MPIMIKLIAVLKAMISESLDLACWLLAGSQVVRFTLRW